MSNPPFAADAPPHDFGRSSLRISPMSRCEKDAFGTVRASRVLVVDDEPVSSLVISNICAHLGAEPANASNGIEALRLLDTESFEVVLLDRNMPELDGFEVLRRIRARFDETELPVVMVTSDDDRESVVSAFGFGANDYITKPLDARTAIARIGTQLRLRRMQRQLAESMHRYELAMQGSNDGIWDWDFASGCVYYSPRWQAMLGFDEADFFGSPEHWFAHIHEDDRQRIQHAIDAHLAGETKHFESELRMRHTSEVYRWMLCRGKAVFDGDGRATRMAGSLTDVTEGKSVDALTGLPNRALFQERVSRRVQQYHRNPSRLFAVLFIDVDDFKQINDTHGHAAGDDLLVSLANAIEANLRRADSVVARLGGDEFAVLVEDIDSEEIGEIVARRLVTALAAPVVVQRRRRVTPSASVGIAFPNGNITSVDSMLRSADMAMYRAKKQGKNGYRSSSTDAE